MKVFLLSINTEQEPYPVYPLGMAVIASALAGAGHKVRQFDFLVMGESESMLCRALQDFQPDVVGLSLRNIDNVDFFSGMEHWSLGRARIIIDLLRSVLKVPIIVGGPAFSIMPEAILDYLGADFGVAGEGEDAVLELLGRIQRKESGPRIVSKSASPGFSCMPPPLFDQEILDFYQKESGLPGLQTKRGCPHHCVYCSYPSLEGRRIRVRDPEEVVDDMARMSQEYGVDHVFFTDSVFNDCEGHYLNLAHALARRNLPVRWSAFFRPAPIRKDDLDLLQRSGLLGMEVGSDAGAEATLSALGKGFSCSDILKFNDICVERGIPVAHYFIIGGPDETEATIKETLDNLEKLSLCVVFIYSGLRILPGTKLLERAKSEGIVTQSSSLLKPVYYHSPLIEKQAMHNTVISALHGRRDRFFPPNQGQDRMKVMRRFGYRGLVWDRLISSEITRRQNRKNRCKSGLAHEA
ncbi:MAG: lipid biosynthesis B12-binding/radical SAM protein [Desulfonatronovibrio sp.]